MKLLRWLLGGHEAETVVRWVEQEEGKGCAVACVAMLLGLCYWQARTLFRDFDPNEGVLPLDVIRALGEYGWASIEKHPHYSPERRDRPHWPVKPFAPVHLCQVITGGWHAVLMLEDGTVFDPLRDPVVHGTVRLSDYGRVLSVAGLWRVGHA